MAEKTHTLLVLSSNDNVGIVASPLPVGSALSINGRTVALSQAVNLGAKIALVPIAKHEKVIKFGAPIGSATEDIEAGQYVHTHNLASDYIPTRAGEV